jgi:hypothetical protein
MILISSFLRSSWMTMGRIITTFQRHEMTVPTQTSMQIWMPRNHRLATIQYQAAPLQRPKKKKSDSAL